MRIPHKMHGIQEGLILINHTPFVLHGIKKWDDAIFHDHWTAIELESRADIELLREAIASDPFVCCCPLFTQASAMFVPSLAGDHICDSIIKERLFGLYHGNYSKTQVFYVEHLSPLLLEELGKPGAKITQGWYCCGNAEDKTQKRGGRKKNGKGPTKSWSSLFVPAVNVLAAMERLRAKARQAGGEYPQSS